MANAYATRQNLYDRFEDDTEVMHLTDSVDSGSIDNTVIDEVVAHAEGEIDSYLARRYLVPIDVTGSTVLEGMLRSTTLDLAVRHLHTRTGSVPDSAELAYQEVILWLEKVSKGMIVLPTPDTPAATSSMEPDSSQGTGALPSERSTSRRLFSRSSMGGL